MEVKLKKEDKEFIDTLKDSSMCKESKKRLIEMIKANRIIMDMILKELDLKSPKYKKQTKNATNNNHNQI